MTFSHLKSATLFSLDSDGAVTALQVADSTDLLTGMTFVWIPGGCYDMGCDSETDGNCSPWEGPLHTVCVDGFWIGKYEVATKYSPIAALARKCRLGHDSHVNAPPKADTPVAARG